MLVGKVEVSTPVEPPVVVVVLSIARVVLIVDTGTVSSVTWVEVVAPSVVVVSAVVSIGIVVLATTIRNCVSVGSSVVAAVVGSAVVVVVEAGSSSIGIGNLREVEASFLGGSAYMELSFCRKKSH